MELLLSRETAAAAAAAAVTAVVLVLIALCLQCHCCAKQLQLQQCNALHEVAAMRQCCCLVWPVGLGCAAALQPMRPPCTCKQQQQQQRSSHSSPWLTYDELTAAVALQ
jgi:hypothetical protein